MNSGHGIA